MKKIMVAIREDGNIEICGGNETYATAKIGGITDWMSIKGLVDNAMKENSACNPEYVDAWNKMFQMRSTIVVKLGYVDLNSNRREKEHVQFIPRKDISKVEPIYYIDCANCTDKYQIKPISIPKLTPLQVAYNLAKTVNRPRHSGIVKSAVVIRQDMPDDSAPSEPVIDFKSVVNYSDVNIDEYIKTGNYDRINTYTDTDISKLNISEGVEKWINEHQARVIIYFSNGTVIAYNNLKGQSFLLFANGLSVAELPNQLHVHGKKILTLDNHGNTHLIDTNHSEVPNILPTPITIAPIKGFVICHDIFEKHGIIVLRNSDMGSDNTYALGNDNGTIYTYAKEVYFGKQSIFMYKPKSRNQVYIANYDDLTKNLVPEKLVHRAVGYEILNDAIYMLTFITEVGNNTNHMLINSNNNNILVENVLNWDKLDDKGLCLYAKTNYQGVVYIINLVNDSVQIKSLPGIAEVRKYEHKDFSCYLAIKNSKPSYTLNDKGHKISETYENIETDGYYGIVTNANDTKSLIDLREPHSDHRMLYGNYLTVGIADGRYLYYGDAYHAFRDLDTDRVVLSATDGVRFKNTMTYNNKTYVVGKDDNGTLIAYNTNNFNVGFLFNMIDVIPNVTVQYIFTEEALCIINDKVMSIEDAETHIREHYICSELQISVVLERLYILSENHDGTVSKLTNKIIELKK